MTCYKGDPSVSTKSSVTTFKRNAKKKPRVFSVEELDGFYVDNDLDRCLHFTFEKTDTLVIDVFNSSQAAYGHTGQAIGIIEVNLKTGRSRLFTEGR